MPEWAESNDFSPNRAFARLTQQSFSRFGDVLLTTDNIAKAMMERTGVEKGA